jgi:hypothetical protein
MDQILEQDINAFLAGAWKKGASGRLNVGVLWAFERGGTGK